jgi:hypothetical protein
MMSVGVHNKILYPKDELSKFPDAWNGRPFVVYHPKMEDGTPVSAAATPDVWEQLVIGQVFNTKYADDALKAEAWIDPDKADLVDEDLINMLENDQNIEVSIGVFVDHDKKPGDWNGEEYFSIARNLRPDHLAALPRDYGACSWEDGAGMPRLNAEEYKKGGRDTKVTRTDLKSMAAALGLAVYELSHEDVRQQVIAALRGKLKLPDGEYMFVRDVFDKHFVYEHESSKGLHLYKQAYSVAADESVEINGDPVEVKPKTEYVPVVTNNGSVAPVGKARRTKHNGSPSPQMNTQVKGGKKMERKDKVDALIALEDSAWSEENRELLMNMSDTQFEQVERGSKEQVAPIDPPAPATNEQKVVAIRQDAPKPTVMSVEEYLQNENLPPEVRETMESALQQQKLRKEELVKAIVANARNTFTEDYLRTCKVEVLEGMVGLAGKRDFSGRAAGTPTVSSHEEEPLVVPVLGASRK